MLILGIILLLISVPFFIISIITVTEAYNSDTLVTKGVYRCCRHPLYGAWVVFIVPGFVLLVNSWIGLTTPLFMYFLLRALVKRKKDMWSAHSVPNILIINDASCASCPSGISDNCIKKL